MAEVTSKSYSNIAPNCDKRLMVVTATSAADGDVLTLSAANSATNAFRVIEGCIGISTTGVPLVGTITGSSNVLTLVNGGALIWNIILWGY